MLGGFTNPKALSDNLAMKNMSESTLRSVEGGRRELEEHEAAAVAKACGLDPAFFTVDLADLHSHDNEEHNHVRTLERVQALLAQLTSEQAGTRTEPQAGQDASTGAA